MMPQTEVSAAPDRLYKDYVNPHWVRLLDLLEMNVNYTCCRGAELFSAEGRRFLDFLSGYCVHNVGHNHPRVIAALKQELERSGPAMLQSHVPELAGELAERLCRLAGGRLTKAFFSSSGSEGVEAAIKFARAHTGRAGLLYAEGAFHGLTCGALSLMGYGFWREGFGPLLPGTQAVPFGNLEALREALATKRFAAFFVEPIQAEAGIRMPDAHYLAKAQELCRRYGTLLVLDEVQTGMYRTGPFLAAHHFGLDPDMVILAKALSGGLVPVGAVLMSDEVNASVYGSLQRAFIHTSTYSDNSLAMRAGLATLQVLDEERLGQNAAAMGAYLRARLRDLLSGYEMVREVPGMGLLSGIVFEAPRQLRLRVPFEAFRKIHPALFGQIVVMRLFRDHGMLTQICGNNFMVLKVAPPLTVREAEIDEFVAAVARVMEVTHTSPAFWSDTLGMARRVANI
ncbi:MAG TPA: aspartate aminotransferase family protein [Bryobacteraceae bacterium]|nr:aspartate aminotransferase family protein [Bryobacteraceae bacterium]